MYNIAIIEDERKYSDLLQSYLERYTKENGPAFKTFCFTSIEDFLLPRSEGFDIVFFDIELPGMNGMEGAKRFREFDVDAVIIFVTNLAKYAINGYEVGAMDYVLKPLSYPNFSIKLDKALRRVEQKQFKSLTLRTKEGVFKTRSIDISYIESRGHTLTFHTDTADIDVTGSLGDYEEMLSEAGFARCDRCFLVNMNRIVRADDTSVFLRDGTVLSISRRKKKDFLAAFTQFIGL